MDTRTGRTYETKEDALAAGVPESDIAEMLAPTTPAEPPFDELPLVRFAAGPFKGRTYRRKPSGQLVRVQVRGS